MEGQKLALCLQIQTQIYQSACRQLVPSLVGGHQSRIDVVSSSPSVAGGITSDTYNLVSLSEQCSQQQDVDKIE